MQKHASRVLPASAGYDKIANRLCPKRIATEQDITGCYRFPAAKWYGVTCSAQVQIPDTPAARQCAAWLEAFNRGDRDTYLAFLETNFPSRVKNLDQARIVPPITGKQKAIHLQLQPSSKSANLQEEVWACEAYSDVITM